MFSDEITKEEFDRETVCARKLYEANPRANIINRTIAKRTMKLQKRGNDKSKEKLEGIIIAISNEIFGHRSEMERIFYRSELGVKEQLEKIAKRLPEAIFVYLHVSVEDDEGSDAGEAWIVALMPDAMAAYEFRKQYADDSLSSPHLEPGRVLLSIAC